MPEEFEVLSFMQLPEGGYKLVGDWPHAMKISSEALYWWAKKWTAVKIRLEFTTKNSTRVYEVYGVDAQAGSLLLRCVAGSNTLEGAGGAMQGAKLEFAAG